MIDAKTKEAFTEALKSGNVLQLSLGDKSLIRIERRLPFLLIYRRQPHDYYRIPDLVKTESSYLITESNVDFNSDIALMVKELARELAEEYGSVMVLEVWVGSPGSRSFVLKTAKGKAPNTVKAFQKGLEDFSSTYANLMVEVVEDTIRHPIQLEDFLTLKQCQEAGIYLMGLEIPPFFQNHENNEFFYLVFEEFRLSFSNILRKAVYEFIRVQTSFDIQNYQRLGSTEVDETVWEVDRQLSEIEAKYQFLLLISPINTMQAKEEFVADNHQKNPKFLYRNLPIDPDRLKEELFGIDIRSIEDPTLSFLYTEKREELEKQITMLKERGTKNFMYSSIRLYSSPGVKLYETAKDLLKTLSPDHLEEVEWVDAYDMAKICREEIERYKKTYPELDSKVEVKNDIVGMLVSRGQLYIGSSFKVPKQRIKALVHHEVGTHVLTFYNGKMQPFGQMSNGFADYDELQEGLAVLAEYLVGGLTGTRLRTLAARVIAGRAVTEGMTFEETYHVLTEEYDALPEQAFQITARAYQGGGCTKDIIYLRGLMKLIEFLQNGGELEPLYVGKIGFKHIPLIQELRIRDIIKPSPLAPSYLKTDFAQERLKKLKEGLTLPELVN
ncbi:flavohemoglobin expression-modulating QEGLA motif protein [Algoriphagus sp. AGSA1]|uniref:flavohemoglobin expression-modulating QEGLA motif protein n=1 Tax=Algoriphagus sp. AGSA1 TaxID=2907213 RepID=UPI001F3F23B4|nr:tyrosine/phenylalanine carboxypeptidase domain-containing protein [Algoriphagus sp. AGSA1]MCE7053588.1 flavohemoglobin expression-modulating QEGLA motif protein [Algoriphagus sp. AGSA1]